MKSFVTGFNNTRLEEKWKLKIFFSAAAYLSNSYLCSANPPIAAKLQNAKEDVHFAITTSKQAMQWYEA